MRYDIENSGHDDSLIVGEFFQNFVKDIIKEKFGIKIDYYTSKDDQYHKGESLQGWEIKYDQHCGKEYSKGVSIEIAEKIHQTDLNWINSGIYRSDNSINFVQGNTDTVIYIFCKKLLQLLHQSGRYKEKEELTIRTFYLPYSDADKYCSHKITF